MHQECVSTRAREAIGYGTAALEVKEGHAADLVLFGKKSDIDTVGQRRRWTVQEVVYDAGPERATVRSGVLIRRRYC